MSRVRFKIRRLFPPLILASFLILTFILLNHHPSLLRHAFYDYPINIDRLPGSYLSARTPNESYCNFRYGLPEELLYEDMDLEYGPEQELDSPYRILYNVIGSRLTAKMPAVTYATHVTADFINYIAEVVRFWEGPVSVAAFVPDFDVDLAIKQLEQLCSCNSEMSRVSVHFVFPSEASPYMQNRQLDKPDCKIPDSSKLATFRNNNGLKYPVNVCRNVARNGASTYFVMVSDIQLIPSAGLASGFMEMVKGRQITKIPSRVFVVPVFEVDAYDAIPRTKEELVVMIREERAVYFHRHICSHCQKFPGIKTWIETNAAVVKPFVAVKREYPFHRWEPIYIGSKNEPLYAEVLSWEGLQDKMTQMLEMCLIGYKFVILDGAFLVHWPGIKKRKSPLKDFWRTSFQRENSKYYEKIIRVLADKYDDNPKCKLQ